MRLKVLTAILAVLSLVMVYFTFHNEELYKENIAYNVKIALFVGCYNGLATGLPQVSPEFFEQHCDGLVRQANIPDVLEFIAKVKENTNGKF